MQPSTLKTGANLHLCRHQRLLSLGGLRSCAVNHLLHCCLMRHAPLPVTLPADDLRRAGINRLTGSACLAAVTSRACSTGQCACWRAA